MRSAHRHLNDIFGTLRFRLTVWNTAVVLSMVVFTLWGVREGLRITLLHEADSLLLEEIAEVRLTIEQLYPDDNGDNLERIYEELDRKAISHTHRGLYIRLFDESDRPLWSSSGSPPLKFSTSLFVRGLTPVTAEEYRLVHVKMDRPGIPRWTIRIGTSLTTLEDEVSQLTDLMLIVGAVVLVVSPLGGYWLAGRATRPLAQIIDTTARLHPSSLDERLPRRETGDELDRLSATINGFLDRLAAYLEQMREFTANAAHELRSPLAAIQSSLEVMLDADRTVDEYKELLGDVLDECTNLSVLVNQLLLLAESDAGLLQFGIAPVRLDQVVQKSGEMFQGVAEFGNVALRVIRLEPVQVEGDAGRLRQVINNLLDNALKFTKPGGKVDVSLTSSPGGEAAVLLVRDTGSGISPEDLPHIFERFYCGDKSRGRERNNRGSGLGLAICQSIVTAHRGRIDVQSTVDRGTTMTVTLPLTGFANRGTCSAPQDGRDGRSVLRGPDVAPPARIA